MPCGHGKWMRVEKRRTGTNTAELLALRAGDMGAFEQRGIPHRPLLDSVSCANCWPGMAWPLHAASMGRASLAWHSHPQVCSVLLGTASCTGSKKRVGISRTLRCRLASDLVDALLELCIAVPPFFSGRSCSPSRRTSSRLPPTP